MLLLLQMIVMKRRMGDTDYIKHAVSFHIVCRTRAFEEGVHNPLARTESKVLCNFIYPLMFVIREHLQGKF